MATGESSTVEYVLFESTTSKENVVEGTHSTFEMEQRFGRNVSGIHAFGKSQSQKSAPHGHLKELPEEVYHAIRFSKDADVVAKWLSSKAQHVDDYRCKTYVSFSEAVGGLTALHLACIYNRPEIIELLLQDEADITVVDELGRNALHCICSSNSQEPTTVAYNMISDRVDSIPTRQVVVNAQEIKYGRTPLLVACLTNKKAIATSLIIDLSADVSVIDYAKMSPLHYVCASQADEVEPLFDFIQEKQRDINVRDSQGRTPLLVACEHNKPSIALKLLKAGSDVFVEDKSHQTCLHYLSASNNETIEELLKIIIRQVTEKAKAEQDSAASASLALDFINKRDILGQTPLMLALTNHHIKNAIILIDSGADIDIRLDGDRSPLQYALESRTPNVPLAIALINHGADISVQIFYKGNSPLLHFACQENFVNLVDCLLNHGADVMEKNADQRRPIYYAQSCSVGRLLLRAGAIDYGHRDPTLLDYCCRKGLIKRAIYLIEHSQNSVKAKHLQWAVKYNYQDIAMALMKHPNWYQFLRHSEAGEDGLPSTPFRELVKKMPDVAEVVLDKCIVSDPKFQDPGDSSYSIILNYEFLEDFAIPSEKVENENDVMLKAHALAKDGEDLDLPEFYGHDCSYESLDRVPQKKFSTKWGPIGFSRSNHVLSVMVKYGREKLLSHPVVSSLLHYKWYTYGHYGYYVNLVTFCLFVLFLNVYALLLDSPLTGLCVAVHRGNLDSFTNLTKNGSNITIRDICDLDNSSSVQIIIYLSATLTILIAVGRFVHETFQVLQRNHGHFVSYFAKLVLYITAILFSIVYFAECQCVADWQWQCGTVAVFLSWVILMIFVARFPLTGIYALMLIQIFYTFIKVLLLTCLLVLAFGLSLYMAFSEPGIRRSPFSTPARSLLKVETMSTGELGFDDLFRQDVNGDRETAREVPFEEVSFIVWILFVVVMPVLFANMLVGLAVGDIHGILKAASLRKMALQVNQVLAVEKTLRRKPFSKILSIAWKKIYPNSPISSMSAVEWQELHRRSRLWKKLCNECEFAIWGGKRYDSLKTPSMIQDENDATLNATSHNDAVSTVSVTELAVELKKTKEELKAALASLAVQISELKTTPSQPSPSASPR